MTTFPAIAREPRECRSHRSVHASRSAPSRRTWYNTSRRRDRARCSRAAPRLFRSPVRRTVVFRPRADRNARWLSADRSRPTSSPASAAAAAARRPLRQRRRGLGVGRRRPTHSALLAAAPATNQRRQCARRAYAVGAGNRASPWSPRGHCSHVGVGPVAVRLQLTRYDEADPASPLLVLLEVAPAAAPEAAPATTPEAAPAAAEHGRRGDLAGRRRRRRRRRQGRRALVAAATARPSATMHALRRVGSGVGGGLALVGGGVAGGVSLVGNGVAGGALLVGGGVAGGVSRVGGGVACGVSQLAGSAASAAANSALALRDALKHGGVRDALPESDAARAALPPLSPPPPEARGQVCARRRRARRRLRPRPPPPPLPPLRPLCSAATTRAGGTGCPSSRGVRGASARVLGMRAAAQARGL